MKYLEKTIKIDEQLHRWLKIASSERCKELKQLINTILREWLERENAVELAKEVEAGEYIS